jgi:hypothetical protein
MFKTTVQPSLVSLFSSVGSHPLQLFSTHVDVQLPEDSLIQLLNDATSLPTPLAPGRLLHPPQLPLNPRSASPQEKEELTHSHERKVLSSTVLHIQSPTLRTTFIHAPPLGSSIGLGLKHTWMHLQVRNMTKEWAFEVGLVDVLGQEGRVRFATFQVRSSSSLARLRLRLVAIPLLTLLF